jgi:tetratricopeptide (TPR) repeat protein
MENVLMDNSRQQALADEQSAAGVQPDQAAEQHVEKSPAAKVEDVTAPLDPAIWASAPLGEKEKAQAQETERQLRGVLAHAYNDLGASQARRHEYDLALSYFRDAERWDPQAPGVMRNVGLAAFFAKNYAESARAFKIVVAQDPSDQRALSMLALSYFSIKDYAQAAKAFDRVGDSALSDPRMAYGWALSLAKTNDRARASAILEKLVAQKIPPEMLVLAGQLYAEIGDQKNAEICFQRAREQDPNVALPR